LFFTVRPSFISTCQYSVSLHRASSNSDSVPHLFGSSTVIICPSFVELGTSSLPHPFIVPIGSSFPHPSVIVFLSQLSVIRLYSSIPASFRHPHRFICPCPVVHRRPLSIIHLSISIRLSIVDPPFCPSFIELSTSLPRPFVSPLVHPSLILP
jgi:hypothetical protein